MTDVRLTATDPDTSQVYPVACDTSGRLIVTPPGVGPPGPEGPQGPEGPEGPPGPAGDSVWTEDAGTAQYVGDIDVTGKATLGQKLIAQDADFGGKVLTEGTGAYFYVDRDLAPGTGALHLGFAQGVQKFKVATDGSGEFAEHLDIGSSTATNAYVRVERSNAGNVFSGNGASGNTSYITDEGSAFFGSYLQVSSGGMQGDYNTYINASVGAEYFIASKAPGDLATSPILWGVKSDGSATFASTLQVGGNAVNGQGTGVQLYPSGSVQVCQGSGSSTVFAGYTEGSTTKTSVIRANGSATFADNKAGITSEGEMWFTSRGTTYKLVIAGGLVSYEEYTPPTRREQIADSVADRVQGSLIDTADLVDETDSGDETDPPKRQPRRKKGGSS